MSDFGYLHRRSETWGKSPEILIHTSTLTDGAKVLYAHMHWRYGSNGQNFEGRESMAEMLDVSETTISDRITELIEHDWVVRVDRRKTNESNVYHVFEHPADCIAYRIENNIPVPDIPLDTNGYRVHGRKPRKGIGGQPTHTGSTQLDQGASTQLDQGDQPILPVTQTVNPVEKSAYPDSDHPDSITSDSSLRSESSVSQPQNPKPSEASPEGGESDPVSQPSPVASNVIPPLTESAINALKVMLSGELLYVTEQPEGLVNYFLVDAVTGDVINVSDADFYLLDLKHGFLDPVAEPVLIAPFDAAWRINEAGIDYLRQPTPETRQAPCFHCNNAVREWTEHPGMKTIWQCSVCHSLVHENILWPAQQPVPVPQPPVEKTTKPRKAKTRWYVFKMVDDQNVYLGPAPSEKAARELIADGTGTLTNQVPEGAKVLDWPKKMQPSDVLGRAIARVLFGANDQAGINAVWGRIAPILHGDKRSNRCDGLIAYECERQGKDKADLDYQALADDVPVFWKDYQATNPGVTQLKDCAKVLDGWQAWRSKPQPKRINPDDYVFVEPRSYVAPGPAR